jgi:hypothetical protein
MRKPQCALSTLMLIRKIFRNRIETGSAINIIGSEAVNDYEGGNGR